MISSTACNRWCNLIIMFKYFLAHDAVLHACKCHGPPLHLCLSSSLGQEECGCVWVCAANLTLVSPFVVICWSTITKPYAREIRQFSPKPCDVDVENQGWSSVLKNLSFISSTRWWNVRIELSSDSPVLPSVQKPAPLVTAVSEVKLLKSGNNQWTETLLAFIRGLWLVECECWE